jgi:microcystin-dependent protein
MTQAVNLANFSNSLDSSGGLAPSALNAAVPYSKGGTAATTQATAQANMGIITGEIKMWGVGTAPTGYLLCNGSAVSRSTYAALFAVYGSTFGSGDGSTTFNLPDFRDRMPIGAGSTYSLAATGGSKDAIVVSHTHTATSVVTDPTHFHSYSPPTTPGGQGTGGLGSAGSANTTAASTGITVATTNAATGSSGTNANLPPYIVVYMWQRTA